MATFGGAAVFISLQRIEADRVIMKASLVFLVTIALLAVGSAIFVILQTIGFHRIQKQIGPSLVTQSLRTLSATQ